MPYDLNMGKPEISEQEILDALLKAQWNVSEAARILQINRHTLRYKIEKFDIKIPKSNFQNRYTLKHYDKVYESMIRNKFNFYKVGKEFGVSYSVAYRWMELMKKYGYELPDFHKIGRSQLERAAGVRAFLARMRLI